MYANQREAHGMCVFPFHKSHMCAVEMCSGRRANKKVLNLKTICCHCHCHRDFQKYSDFTFDVSFICVTVCIFTNCRAYLRFACDN